MTLELSSSSIGENGGAANVTASLSGASSQAANVVVSASPVVPAVSGYFTITSDKTISIAPGFTSSTGTVTITSVYNSVDAPDKSISVRMVGAATDFGPRERVWATTPEPAPRHRSCI